MRLLCLGLVLGALACKSPSRTPAPAARDAAVTTAPTPTPAPTGQFSGEGHMTSQSYSLDVKLGH